MSTIGSATSVMASGGTSRRTIQIAVPTIVQSQGSTSDGKLEAAVQRVSALLYTRSHLATSSDVTDMGGGLFNVVV